MNKRLATTLVTSAAASLIGAGVLVAADPPRRPTSAPTTAPNDRERYGVLTEQNMFLKDRRTGRTPQSRSTSREMSAVERALLTPEASFVLTGVVFEDGDFRAFIEDIKGGKVLRLSVGDPVARGKITQIDIDTAAYFSDGKQTIINVGQTLTGIPYSAFTSPSASSSSSGSGGGDSSSGVAPSPLPDPNNPNLTIEDRLKLRRAAELKK